MALNPIDSNSDLEIIKVVCEIAEVKQLKAYIDGTIPTTGLLVGGITTASTIAFGPVGLIVGLGLGSLSGSLYMNNKSNLKGPDIILGETNDAQKRLLAVMLREVIKEFDITTLESFNGNINVNQSFRKKIMEAVFEFGKKCGIGFRYN